MDLASFYSSEVFTLVIIPLLIFMARICDVTLDTARIIYESRGMKLLAAVIGFFEVLIWLISITQIIHNLTNIIYYVAYAGGFAMGNFIGTYSISSVNLIPSLFIPLKISALSAREYSEKNRKEKTCFCPNSKRNASMTIKHTIDDLTL